MENTVNSLTVMDKLFFALEQRQKESVLVIIESMLAANKKLAGVQEIKQEIKSKDDVLDSFASDLEVLNNEDNTNAANETTITSDTQAATQSDVSDNEVEESVKQEIIPETVPENAANTSELKEIVQDSDIPVVTYIRKSHNIDMASSTIDTTKFVNFGIFDFWEIKANKITFIVDDIESIPDNATNVKEIAGEEKTEPKIKSEDSAIKSDSKAKVVKKRRRRRKTAEVDVKESQAPVKRRRRRKTKIIDEHVKDDISNVPDNKNPLADNSSLPVIQENIKEENTETPDNITLDEVIPQENLESKTDVNESSFDNTPANNEPLVADAEKTPEILIDDNMDADTKAFIQKTLAEKPVVVDGDYLKYARSRKYENTPRGKPMGPMPKLEQVIFNNFDKYFNALGIDSYCRVNNIESDEEKRLFVGMLIEKSKEFDKLTITEFRNLAKAFGIKCKSLKNIRTGYLQRIKLAAVVSRVING